MYCIFVGINCCCVLGPLTIYFLLKLNSLQKKDHAYFIFSKPFDWGFFFFFFFKQIYLYGLIPLEKYRFRLWLGFFFLFLFQTNLFLMPYSLRGLRQPPNLPSRWAGSGVTFRLYCILSAILSINFLSTYKKVTRNVLKISSL
jgi:hypothetical protein